jgi:hypothetical protein
MTDKSAGARDITAVLRTLFPAVNMSTRSSGDGEFTVTLPSAAAFELGLGNSPRWAESYIGRHLGVRAEITGSRIIPRRDGGKNVIFTLRLGPGKAAGAGGRPMPAGGGRHG